MYYRSVGILPQPTSQSPNAKPNRAYFSFEYGTPIDLGATARPTNPASSRTVRTYGNARINCTGTIPTKGSATPCNLVASASVKANSKHAISVGYGRHLPKINAASAR